MERRNLRQWQAWRENSRCTRPAVTCQKCDTHYPRGKDEGNAIYNGFNLVECGNCQAVEFHPSISEREFAKAKTRCTATLVKHIAKHRKRTIYRDVAIRYLQRFGGSTFTVRTAIDAADIYLENAKGRILGSVTYSDKYPKPPATDFSDMPF